MSTPDFMLDVALLDAARKSMPQTEENALRVIHVAAGTVEASIRSGVSPKDAWRAWIAAAEAHMSFTEWLNSACRAHYKKHGTTPWLVRA